VDGLCGVLAGASCQSHGCRACNSVATRGDVTQRRLGASFLIAESLNRIGQPVEIDASLDHVLVFLDPGVFTGLLRYALCGATLYAVSTMRGKLGRL